MEALKPGIHWDAIQLLCHRTLVRGFQRLGIFKTPDAPGSRCGGRKNSRREKRESAADAPRTAFHMFLENLMRWISGTIVVSDPPAARTASKSERSADSAGVLPETTVWGR